MSTSSSRDAFLVRLECHRPLIHALVRLNADRVLLMRDTCSDLAQTVFRHLLASWGKFSDEGEAAFRSWIVVTARNKLLDRRRRQLRQRRAAAREVELDALSDTLKEELLMSAYRPICTPSQHAASREQIARFEAAFAKLPESCRDAITLARLGGLTYPEVATRLGKSTDAVRMLVNRGLARLAVLLEEPK